MRTKLILVEGIPGGGKTTTADYIHNYLNQNNIPNHLYMEGDLNHPADFESVACLNEEEYNKIKVQFNSNADLLDKHLIKDGEDYFLEYRKLNNQKNINLNQGLFYKLAAYDIYNLKLNKHSRLLKEKWKRFAQKTQNQDQIYIFECCFLQNPLTTMLAYHNADKDYIVSYIKELAAIISELNPYLILLQQKNVEQQFAKISKDRSQEWLNFVIDYITTQSYGRENNLDGYQGVINFYQTLSEFEREIFSQLNLNKLLVQDPHSNWEKSYQKIDEFLLNN